MVIFDKENKKLYSVDPDDWNKEEIDLKLFGISIVDF